MGAVGGERKYGREGEGSKEGEKIKEERRKSEPLPIPSTPALWPLLPLCRRPFGRGIGIPGPSSRRDRFLVVGPMALRFPGRQGRLLGIRCFGVARCVERVWAGYHWVVELESSRVWESGVVLPSRRARKRPAGKKERRYLSLGDLNGVEEVETGSCSTGGRWALVQVALEIM